MGEEHRGPRTYVCVAFDGLGLLRLAGTDPNALEPMTGTSPVPFVDGTGPDGNR